MRQEKPAATEPTPQPHPGFSRPDLALLMDLKTPGEVRPYEWSAGRIRGSHKPDTFQAVSVKETGEGPHTFLGKTFSLYSERRGEKWATSTGYFSGNNITFFSNLAMPRLLVISTSLEGERITASTCTQLYDWVAGKMLCPVVLQALSASKEGRTKRVF